MDPSELNDDKQTRLRGLRQRLGDVVKPSHDDRYLLKWLVARKFDVAKADIMYRKSMKWRDEVGADTIQETFRAPEVLQLYYPGGVFGEDRHGRPVFIDPIGRIDLRGILGSVQKRDLMKHVISRCEYTYEVFRQQSKKCGRTVDQCTQVIDIEGFGSNFIWRPALDFYVEMLSVLSENYPEVLYKTYIINAPSLFRTAYNVFKSFVDEGTSSKFVLLDGNWKDVVFAGIDPAELPVYYGGVQKDPDGDPKCPSKIGYGGKVPEKYYFDKKGLFSDDDSTEVCHLGRRGEVRVDVTVEGDTEVLKWLFMTEAGDIQFCLQRACADGDGHETLVERKVNCERVPEDDMYICSGPAMYTMVFKNPSMLSTRKLTYMTEVVCQPVAPSDTSVAANVSTKL